MSVCICGTGSFIFCLRGDLIALRKMKLYKSSWMFMMMTFMCVELSFMFL